MKNPKTTEIEFVNFEVENFGSCIRVVRRKKTGGVFHNEYKFSRREAKDISRFETILDYMVENNYDVVPHYKDCGLECIEYFPPIVSDSSIYLSDAFSGIAGTVDIQVDEEEEGQPEEKEQSFIIPEGFEDDPAFIESLTKKPRNIAEWINEILEEEEVDRD